MHAMDARTRLGDLQFAIMEVLWAGGEATVAEVHEALRGDRGLAPTTIATMLRKMEAKGVVDHREEGRTFVYRPLVERGDVRRSMVGDLTDMLFGGNAAELVSHLISDRDIDPEDLARLRRMIDQKEREQRAKGGER